MCSRDVLCFLTFVCLLSSSLSNILQFQIDCNVFVSLNGSDTSGDGSLEKPYLTVLHALQSQNASKVPVTLCLTGGGTFKREVVAVDTHKFNSLTIRGFMQPAILDSFRIVPSGAFSENFTLTFSDLHSQFLTVDNTSNSFFPNVEFHNVSFIGKDETESFKIYGYSVILSQCNVFDVVMKGFWVDAGGFNQTNGTVGIYGLSWKNNVGGIVIERVKGINIRDSVFENSIGPLVMVPEDLGNNSTVEVSVMNVIFSHNSWNDNSSSLVEFPAAGTIDVVNCSFICNNGSMHIYPPVFSATSSSISVSNLNIDPKCPISCPTVGTYLVSSVFECLPCPPGQYSLNNFTCTPCPISYYVLDNKCTICPAGTFSQNNYNCTDCPVFSSQPQPGMDHCTCFTNVLVDNDNNQICNNHFWGFIVGAVYALVLVGIIVFWVRRKPEDPYEQ